MRETLMLDGLEPPAPSGAGDLVGAAERTITALREQDVIQPWHELDCAIVVETARGVSTSRGIAKSQMIAALLQARAKLPDPVVAETDESVATEAARVEEWLRARDEEAEVLAVMDA